MRRPRLRTRLVASFVAVALVGVATLAALVLLLLPARLSQMVVERQDQAARQAVQVLEDAYRRHDGWSRADLRRAGSIIAGAGGGISITTKPGVAPPGDPPPGGATSTSPNGGDGGGDSGGGTPSQSPSAQRHSQPPGSGGGGSANGGKGPIAAGADETDTRSVRVPIVVNGETVGTLTVTYPTQGLPTPERDFEASLRWSIAVAAAVAVLVAAGVALFVARRIDRPLSRLIRTARRLGSGDLSARVGRVEAPGEVGDLAATFDQMADALAREDEVRRILVADVAHELRTPVTILQASLEEMVDGTTEPETDRLSSLHDEVLRLARTLQDLEALAAAQAAGLGMTATPVDLARVAGEALDRLRPSFAAAAIVPHVALELVTVRGDPTRLDQVVTNLLTNAMKFTPAGGEVWVSVATANGDARIEVTDSGPGISDEEIPHLFERFWRGRAGKTTSGSGVGLAVVAELVRAHHGRVEVSSAPDEGATFSVILPRA